MALRNLSIVAASAVVLGTTLAASAAPFAYEPFNYTTTLANGTATTGTGFSGNVSVIDPGGNPGPASAVVTGLTYPSLPTASNAITLAGFNRVTENLTTAIDTATPVVYASYLIKGSGNPGATPIGLILQGSTASLFAGFGDGFSNDNTVLGLGTTTSGTTPANVNSFTGGGNYSNTSTLLVVVQANLLTNTFTLYVNPTAGTNVPPVPPAIATYSLDIGNLTGFSLQTIGGTLPTYDEVRFGNTFGDVVGSGVPEPTSLGLLGLGSLALLRRKRA